MPSSPVKLNLYFDSKYGKRIDQIKENAEFLASKFRLDFKGIDCFKMSESQKLEIAERIRAVIPQKRGSIVTSRNSILPLSGKKNPNLQNTSILIVSKDQGDIYVFPCRIGERYYSVVDGLSFLEDNLPDLPELPGETETDLSSLILSTPDLIEKGLHDPKTEVQTGAGTIDILFLDASSRTLLVEVEREADDAPLGQILRLCAAYEKSHPSESPRGMIACLRARDFVQAAAKKAGIEIKIVKIRNTGTQS